MGRKRSCHGRLTMSFWFVVWVNAITIFATHPPSVASSDCRAQPTQTKMAPLTLFTIPRIMGVPNRINRRAFYRSYRSHFPCISQAKPFHIPQEYSEYNRNYRDQLCPLPASANTQFHIGDEVVLDIEDKAASEKVVVGVIEEKSGNGWYTISLSNESHGRDGEISIERPKVKRRGPQLKLLCNSGDENTSTSSSLVEREVVEKDVNSESTAHHNSSEDESGIIDLDAILQSTQQFKESGITDDNIRQVRNCHSKCNKWVVFSDLHVMPSTLSTCLKVLDFVHATALRRNAGIMFLGDFWHHRGFVRVDCLNAVLEAMGKWKVPSIMIPGNHDQIDWRGTDHALTPLRTSYQIFAQNSDREHDDNDIKSLEQYPGPLILSQPTKLFGALFVPHIRDKKRMNSVLASKEAFQSNALFVHADVKGASMNDLIESQHGISASAFPPERLVYSGHFHKPHEIVVGKKSHPNSVSIRYVGSPYQTSLSEAGQTKSLLVVDSAKNWECIDEIAIDVGRKYHRVSSVNDFLGLAHPEKSNGLRQGDKVAVMVPQQILDEMRVIAHASKKSTNDVSEVSPFDAKVNELRASGVSVEIRDTQPQLKDSGTTPLDVEQAVDEVQFEDLSPEATLEVYISNEVASGSLGESTAEKILKSGVEILKLLSDVDSNISHSSTLPSFDKSTDIEIDSVSIAGFGSFRREVFYPLGNRGVVLLRGTNKDFGSDSNGVGKTTLAMASLWALTGSIDARPAQDGRVSDVVNDFSKFSEVTLRGRLNSKEFTLKRKKGASSGSLTFNYDGSDLTLQSLKDTQILIDEYFGTTLTRSIFHGQHALDGLLETTDAKFKEELSHLLSLDIWQQATTHARSKQREMMREVAKLDGMIALRMQDLEQAEKKLTTAKQYVDKRKIEVESARKAAHEKEQLLLSGADHDTSDIEGIILGVQEEMKEARSEIRTLEEEFSIITKEGNDEINILRSRLEEKTTSERKSAKDVQFWQRSHDSASIELKSAEKHFVTLRAEWNLGPISNNSSLITPKTCRSCGQKITSSSAQNHIRSSVEKQLEEATKRIAQAQESVSAASEALEKAVDRARIDAAEVRDCMELIRHKEKSHRDKTDGIRTKLKQAQDVQSKLSLDLAAYSKKAKQMVEADLIISKLRSDVERVEDVFNTSMEMYQNQCMEVERIDDNISALKHDKDALTNEVKFTALLVDVFGTKGVQAFVLQNVIQALQYRTQTYLNELSDGSLQLRLEVGTNDSIVKKSAVRDPDGTWRNRPLSSLSGGQWRRISLSLSLGFSHLASTRGKFRSSLLVLDEPLTHLDSAGRASVGKLLRKMISSNSGLDVPRDGGGIGLSTILVILQDIAAEEIEECFDCIDEVVKLNGESVVVVDEGDILTP